MTEQQVDLDALEARAKTRQAIDSPDVLALIAELRQERERAEARGEEVMTGDIRAVESEAAAHRWLAEHDRQVAERAWDEGYEAAAGFHEGREKGHWENDFPAKGMRTWRPDPAPTSPYREKGEQK